MDKQILFQASNWGYEEGYCITIYETKDGIFVHSKGNFLMGGDFDTTRQISSDEALEIMTEEIDNEDDDYLGYD